VKLVDDFQLNFSILIIKNTPSSRELVGEVTALGHLPAFGSPIFLV
jgi:hypothetical protein